MSRLCWSEDESRFYAAFGRAVYGFGDSHDQIRHHWTVSGFNDDILTCISLPDDLLAVASGRSVCIVDPRRGTKHVVPAHADTVYALLFDYTMGILFTSGKDRELKAWRLDTSSHELIPLAQCPNAHDDWIVALETDPTARILLSAAMDGVIKAWRLVEDRNTFVLLTESDEVHTDGILALRYGASREVALSAGRDGRLRSWRLRLGGLKLIGSTEMAEQAGWSRAVRFDVNGGLVASGGDDGVVSVWRLRSQKPLVDKTGAALGEDHNTMGLEMLCEAPSAHAGSIKALYFNPEFFVLVSADDSGGIMVNRLNDTWLDFVAGIKAHPGGPVVGLEVDAASGILVSAGSDGMIKTWHLDAERGKIDPVASIKARAEGSILALQFDVASGIIMAASFDGSIGVWRIEGSTLELVVHVSKAHVGSIFALKYDASSGIVVSAGSDKAIRIWRLEGSELHMLGSNAEELTDTLLNVQADIAAGIVLSTGLDGVIRVWRLVGGTLKLDHSPMSAKSDTILAMQYDAPSGLVMSVGVEGLIRVWHYEHPGIIAAGVAMEGHSSRNRTLHFDPSSSFVASAGYDGTVRAFRLDGYLLVPLGAAVDAHTDGARVVLVSGSKSLVISAGDDGAIKAWRIREWSFDLVATTSDAHKSPIFTLNFGSASGRLVTSSMDGVINLWRKDGSALQHVATNANTGARLVGVIAFWFDDAANLALSGSIDGVLRTWRLDGAVLGLVASTPAHDGPIRGLRVDLTSTTVITAGQDGALRSWRLQQDGSLVPIATMELAHNEICTMDFDCRLPAVATGGDDGTIRIWNYSDAFELSASATNAHSGACSALHLLPRDSPPSNDNAYVIASDSFLLSAGKDGAVCIWRSADKSDESTVSCPELRLVTKVWPCPGVAGGILATSFDPASGVLLCSVNNHIVVWMLLEGREQLVPIAASAEADRPTGGVVALLYDPASCACWSAGMDRKLRTWQLQGGGPLELKTAAMSSHGQRPFSVNIRASVA